MKSYVNIAGIIVVTIVLYHIGQLCKVSVVSDGSIYAFHFLTPWFFFKSGTSYKPGSKIKVLLRNLLLPFAFFTIIGCVVNSLFMMANGDYNWRHHLLTPIIELVCDGATSSNPPLWFLLSLFFCNILCDIFVPILKNSFERISLFIVCCVLVAWCCNVFDIIKPMYLANTFAGLAFFLTGFCMKEKQYDNRVFIVNVMIIIVSICTVIPCVDIRSNILYAGYYSCYYPYVIACCIVINNLFYRLPLCNKMLMAIGLNSYFIYVSHWIVISIINHSVSCLLSGLSFSQQVISVIVLSTISVSILCAINNRIGGLKFITKRVGKRSVKNLNVW